MSFAFLADRRVRSHFLLMFGLASLLNVNYAILRSVRSALAVADLGGSASSIPYFELIGTLPGAILMAWGLTWLMKRYFIHKVFFITLFVFLSFFLIFVFGIYPALPAWKAAIQQMVWLTGREAIAHSMVQFFAMLFFVMAELWKVAFVTILFWGLVNQYVSLGDAKKLYAPLMLAASVGAIVAGPLITLCSSKIACQWMPFSGESWTQSLTMIVLLLCFVGLLAAFFYHKLWSDLSRNKEKFSDAAETIISEKKSSASFKESIQICLNSPYLRLLCWIVLADYIAYSLGEVIFLEVLKRRYPAPEEYCHFMGQLSFWSGILTAVNALVVTPWVLKHFRWVVASLVAPFCLLILGGTFFIMLQGMLSGQHWFGWSQAHWLEVLVLLGSLHYCLCRAAKYTLFDTSKELAFVLLPDVEKMPGKLVADGISSRLGRGGASLLSICLIQLCNGVLGSSLIGGIVAIAIALSAVMGTRKLGNLVDNAQMARGEAQ